MSNPDDPATWMAKAAEDLLCIDNNLGAKIAPWNLVAFHAQQAAEKALKALLARAKIVIPRTHDLEQLLSQCAAVGVDMNGLMQCCVTLMPYAVAIRYPGDEPDASEQDARAAVEAARRVIAAVTAELDRLS